ncbi:MAG: CARDB domain-containing protein [Halobacteriaceae archaeon]
MSRQRHARSRSRASAPPALLAFLVLLAASGGAVAPGRAVVDADAAGPPAVLNAVEYDASAVESHPSSEGGDVQLTFDEPVFAPDGGSPSTGADVAVYVDGENVTGRFEVGSLPVEDGSRGRVVLRSDEDLRPPRDVVVRVGTVRDADGNAATPGNVSVTVSSQTVVPNGENDTERLEADGFVPGETVVLDFKDFDDAFEIRRGGEVVVSGRTGVHSHLYAWNTTGMQASATYRIADVEDDGEDGLFTPYDVRFAAPFEVVEVRAPRSVAPERSVEVTVVVRNGGAARGTTPVELRAGGGEVGRRSVSVPPGASRRVEFAVAVPANASGTYDLTAVAGAGSDARESVTVTVSAADGDESDGDESDGGGSTTRTDGANATTTGATTVTGGGAVGFTAPLALLALLALLAAALVARRRVR